MSSDDVEAGLLALSVPPDPGCSGRVIQSSLVTLRKHLGMDVAFVGRFSSGCRVFEYVDAASPCCPIRPGGDDPTEETYCGRVVEGLIPQLIRDAGEEPGVADLAATRELPVGAHLSVPLTRMTGEVLGTLCCFSYEPDHTLRERDLRLMRMFAELVSAHMETLLQHEDRVGRVRARVREVIEQGGPAIAVQPIVALERLEAVGYEALSRFPAGPDVDGFADAWDPARWFHEAQRAGMSAELETAAVTNALAVLGYLPDAAFLSVNLSGATLCHPSTADLLLGANPPRLIVELTEHVPISNYLSLAGPLARLRDAGVRLAVDDAGSGYAGLEHILRLRPDIVKLDRFLITGVTKHPGRRALVTAMTGFAREMGVELVAEGIETAQDVETLLELGVRLGQGFHLGRPSLDLLRSA